MANQQMSAEERVAFILAEGPFDKECLNALPPDVLRDYLLTADNHLQRVGPEQFKRNREALQEYSEKMIFQERWEFLPM